MSFVSQSFPASWLWISWLLLGLALPWLVWRASWRELAQGSRLHHWAGAILAVSLAWSLKGALMPGFNLHLLGACLLALMFSWPLACLAMLLAASAACLNAGDDWGAFALNLLSAGWLPVLVSTLWLRWTQRRLPHHYFVFLFVTTCLGAVLSVFAVGVAATVLMAASGVLPLAVLLQDYSPFFILLAFSEAWLTGMAITLMVVWRPGWVGSFDDARYLGRS